METYRSAEYNHISDFFTNLNDNGGLTYDRIKDLKTTGGLNYLFETINIDKDFKTILDRFITILNDSLDGLPFTRKFLANTYSELSTIFYKYGYSFGAYLNNNILLFPENNKLFFRFPLFFKCACQKYNIEPYASMSEEDLKNKLIKYMDITCVQATRPRADRTNPEYEEIVYPYSTSYHDKYDEYYSNNISSIKDFSVMDDTEFIQYMSVAAEEYIFNLLCQNGKDNKFWVAQYVDRFGYDILSFDNKNQTEILAEVKSSFKNDYFELTTNEYNTIMESASSPNTEYRIYKIFYNRSSMLPEKVDCYVYNKKLGMFIDMKNIDYGCQIDDFIDDDGRLKYRCRRKKAKDIKNDVSLTLKLKRQTKSSN